VSESRNMSDREVITISDEDEQDLSSDKSGSSDDDVSAFDDPKPLSALKQRLEKELNKICGPPAVAGSGYFPAFTDPEVYVGSHGPLLLPLSEEDARRIVHSAHQAPFGRGHETIIDSSMRKTWELNNNEFELRGADWQQYTNEMVRSVAKKMHLNPEFPGFHAELYKMLLYEKGAMFKSHQE